MSDLEALAEKLGIRLGSVEVDKRKVQRLRHGNVRPEFQNAAGTESTSSRPRRPPALIGVGRGVGGGRPRQALCVRGHDLSVTRRFVKGKPHDCRACHVERKAVARVARSLA